MASIPLNSRFRVRPGVLVRELDGEAVLLDITSGHYFSLNATGRQILDLVDGVRTLEAILKALVERYEVPREELEADLVDHVDELERAGLLLRLE